MLHERAMSPYPFYGIKIYEATDCSDKSIMLAFIRFVNSNGVLVTSFLGVKELQMQDSDSVMSATQCILNDYNLPVEQMFGLATDGASVMTGIHTGVATRFKQIVGHLISAHCMVHRLQLLSEKAANCVQYITKYVGVLNEFAKALKFSPKFQGILTESKRVSGAKARTIHQIFFTRWLSFVSSVQALAL